MRERCAVSGAEFAGDRMTGVRLDEGVVLHADLVVDATGRPARSLGWLEAAGYPLPPLETVEVDTRYATQIIYGQGMTSAAMQARALGACLDRARAVDRRFARRYHKAIAGVVAAPWSVAVGGDFAYPGTTGSKPIGTDLLNRYTRRVTVAAQHDDRVATRFNEVVAMVRRPEALLAPTFVLRSLRASTRGRAPTRYRAAHPVPS